MSRIPGSSDRRSCATLGSSALARVISGTAIPSTVAEQNVVFEETNGYARTSVRPAPASTCATRRRAACERDTPTGRCDGDCGRDSVETVNPGDLLGEPARQPDRGRHDGGVTVQPSFALAVVAPMSVRTVSISVAEYSTPMSFAVKSGGQMNRGARLGLDQVGAERIGRSTAEFHEKVNNAG